LDANWLLDIEPEIQASMNKCAGELVTLSERLRALRAEVQDEPEKDSCVVLHEVAEVKGGAMAEICVPRWEEKCDRSDLWCVLKACFFTKRGEVLAMPSILARP